MTDAATPQEKGSDFSLPRAILLIEVLIVFGLSLGRSSVYSVVSLISSLTRPESLRSQNAALNSSLAPGRPWLDLTYQLLSIGFALVPVALACYLLWRTGDSVRQHVLGQGDRVRDALRGAALAAGVGSTGIAFYLLTREMGINLTVVASGLPDVWWRYPVLVLSALQNSLVEEVLVVGFLMTRLRQMGVTERSSIIISALVRGSYHLYQGIGGFLGNAAMGVLFAWLYGRWGRVMPLIIAHTFLDIGAFVGYALLVDRVPFLSG